MRKICIVGGGNGAFAAAGDLALRGFGVNLLEFPGFATSIDTIQEHGGIKVESIESTGLLSGFARLDRITTDPKQAFEDVELIFTIVPSFALKSIADFCIPHLKPRQTMVITPGNFGSAEWVKRQQDLEVEGVDVGEASCMIYACRKTDPGTIKIRGYKHHLGIAAYPAGKTSEIVKKVRRVYPEVESASNILETGLSNVNPLFHPPILLLNIGRVEDTEGDFLFYIQGSTESIGRVIETIDQERRNIGRGFQVNLPTGADLMQRWYKHQGLSGNTIFELHKSVVPYQYSKAPSRLDTRYLTEDIPFGLVLWAQLGKIAKVPTPTIDSLIHLACTATGTDLRVASNRFENVNWLNSQPEKIIAQVNAR
jgi:opine dehydrogenase